MRIVNERMLKLREYWVQSPAGYWWDGRGFVTPGHWRFTTGKFKSHCSSATAKTEEVDSVLRKAKVAIAKTGAPGKVEYSAVFMHDHIRRKSRRFMSDYETMGLVP